jgi:hypothetical protein
MGEGARRADEGLFTPLHAEALTRQREPRGILRRQATLRGFGCAKAPQGEGNIHSKLCYHCILAIPGTKDSISFLVERPTPSSAICTRRVLTDRTE